MRAGLILSAVGHIGAVLMTLYAWRAAPEDIAASGIVVPIEIVTVAPVSNVRALAPPVDDEAPEEAEEAAPETPPEAAPSPTPTPTPPPREERERFDLAAIARMADRAKQPGRERVEGAPSDRTQRGAGLGSADVARIEDRITALTRSHLQRCWRMPADLPEPDRLVVTVSFEVDRNGALRGQPRVVSPSNYTFDPPMRVAAEAALRAVRACDPYPYPNDPVVGEHYDLWRAGEFRFIPPR